ncbi:PGG domain-containing protein [Citrus sinensis]|uniref:PGG domain-containing protein n=1 Tax=Citrus sinensis TaxID=2711 RepID=A0ACB8NDG0_CITSI|nr:PGG domain-containing protein [Citrus sinensis]
MSGLIEQQDILITLVEQIAHGGHATTKKDAVTSSCDDTPAPADQKLPELTRSRRLQTYRAALNGDWAVAKSIYDVYEGEIGIAIAKRGDTALRIAAAGKYIEFVKELVKIMEAEDLAKPNKHGGTALSYAAASGRESAEDVEVQRLQALKLVERLCGKVALLSDSEISRLISKPGALIFDAAKQGNVGFLLILTREYPNLVWNKVDEVEKVVQRGFAEAKNREGLTPRALFTKEHKDLRETGEKWMKDTATSCMFVATLIATVVFVAAFTVPRSNREDTGFPFFLEKFSENFSFKIFAISDAISLVSSSASVVNFLSILTPRYAEEDFLRLLPRKLLLGLATLFISVAAMMVVFSTTFFILLAQETLWIAILVSVIASTPVILFIWQHFRLFYDVLRSTYVSGSLFQIGKTSLFRKEGETSERQNNTKIFNAHWEIQCTCSTNV